MISEAEIRRNAGALGVDPMIVDLDYVLGVFLSEWYREEEGKLLRFKGGTCLRKCYFPNHRFSKDLDFTAEFDFDDRDIEALLQQVVQRIGQKFNLNLVERALRQRVVQDQQGGTTLEIRLYYRGPLRRTGAPQAIQLHITTSGSEYLLPTKNDQKIIHPYSDGLLLDDVTVPCYTLQEILSEKLRALCGQRRFAISRDVFDVHRLVTQGKVELDVSSDLIRRKFKSRKMSMREVATKEFTAKRDAFEHDWERDLQHLLPTSNEITFDEAWRVTTEVVAQIESLGLKNG